MGKKLLLNIFSLLLLAFLTFSVYTLFLSPSSITIFRQHTNPYCKISRELLNNFKSEEETIKSDAEKEIIETTLHALEYEKWLEFVDYIDLKLYNEKVLPGEASQLLIALNLSKDAAVIAVFEELEREYIFRYKIENLVSVESIEFFSISSHSHKLMAVYQVLNEKFGSFFYERFLEIYLYFPQGFKKLWQKTLYYEEVYKEIWLNPNSNEDLWNKVIEETIIDYVFTEPLKINTLTTFKKYTAQSKNLPKEGQFTLIHSNSYNRSYYWSNQYNTFILGEITKDVFLSEAAVLEDMEIGRESLYGFPNKNYKIITSKGEILYLPKNKFERMFHNIINE